MIRTGLNKYSLILVFLGFFVLILLPLYLIIYSFYIYYKLVLMPFFLIFLPVFALLLYLLYILIFILESKIVATLLNHQLKEGRFRTDSLSPVMLQFSINGLFVSMIESLFDKLLIPKSIIADITFKLFGLKKGKNVMLSQPVLDSYLIEMGDNIIVGKNSLIVSHFIVGDTIYVKRTKIGNNVTIGANSIIGPGVIIEDGVIVGANSFVKQDSVLKKKCLYAGSPAVLKKKIQS